MYCWLCAKIDLQHGSEKQEATHRRRAVWPRCWGSEVSRSARFQPIQTHHVHRGHMLPLERVCMWVTLSRCPLSPLLVLQPGDNKLAHSAQMYHYQHQKQQMLSLEKWVTFRVRDGMHARLLPLVWLRPCASCRISVKLKNASAGELCRHRDEPKVPDSGASTDEENDDGDFTVYECPGLAPVSRLKCILLLTSDWHVKVWCIFFPMFIYLFHFLFWATLIECIAHNGPSITVHGWHFHTCTCWVTKVAVQGVLFPAQTTLLFDSDELIWRYCLYFLLQVQTVFFLLLTSLFWRINAIACTLALSFCNFVISS